MANSIAAETPVANDGILWCSIDKDTVNPTTGVIETAGLVGATGVEAFFSATRELSSAAEIAAGVKFTLANVTGTNVYFSYYTGAAMVSALLPTYKDQKVYVHFKKGTEWHEVAETTIVDERMAAA